MPPAGALGRRSTFPSPARQGCGQARACWRGRTLRRPASTAQHIGEDSDPGAPHPGPAESDVEPALPTRPTLTASPCGSPALTRGPAVGIVLSLRFPELKQWGSGWLSSRGGVGCADAQGPGPRAGPVPGHELDESPGAGWPAKPWPPACCVRTSPGASAQLAAFSNSQVCNPLFP